MLYNMIKTFNVDDKVYQKFMEFCKLHGISMSKQVEIFMKSQLEEGEVREGYLQTLENLRKGKFIKIGTMEEFKKRYQ